MKLLDMFCCAGGASAGYAQAGFEVVGTDIEPQKNYPYEFRQGDFRMLTADEIRDEFDAVHASPPCHAFTSLKALHNGKSYPDFVAATRALLIETGLPYVIENVPGAPLIDPVTLCGSSFGLRVRRHRLFETNFPLVAPPCDHAWQNADKKFRVPDYHSGKPEYAATGVVSVHGGGHKLFADETVIETWSKAMGIDWMKNRHKELAQSIPPAYTRYIGDRLRQHILDQRWQPKPRVPLKSLSDA